MEDVVSIMTKLDEDFLYILRFASEGVEVFAVEEEQILANQWMKKLCQVYEGISQKRLRNNYLALLVACYQTGKLSDRFLEYPVQGNLKDMELLEGNNGDNEIPPWLQDLNKESLSILGETKAKDYRSYMKTKVFDDQRGACAYLAVSVADEGQVPQWIEMGISGRAYFDTHMEKLYKRLSFDRIGNKEKANRHKPEIQNDDEDFVPPSGPININELDEFIEPTKMELEIKRHILEAIATEMAGLSHPGDDHKLENTLCKYHEFIQGSELAKAAKELRSHQLRSYLLVNLEAHLLNK